MARARVFTHQRDPAIAKLKDESKANVEDLERRVKALETSNARLVRLADWVRGALYRSIVIAFALIPSAAPSEPPK